MATEVGIKTVGDRVALCSPYNPALPPTVDTSTYLTQPSHPAVDLFVFSPSSEPRGYHRALRRRDYAACAWYWGSHAARAARAQIAQFRAH